VFIVRELTESDVELDGSIGIDFRLGRIGRFGDLDDLRFFRRLDGGGTGRLVRRGRSRGRWSRRLDRRPRKLG
jgi:hypothetical protein